MNEINIKESVVTRNILLLNKPNKDRRKNKAKPVG